MKQVQDRDVVLLVAGSGYGKTVLAKLIAEEGPGPVAWYGAADSDDAVSTTRLVTLALARAWPDVDTDLPAGSGPDGLAPHLAYVLAEIAGPGTIVIDDIHRLPEAVARPLLTTLAAGLPDGVKLVIASHEDPPLETTPALIACGRALQLGVDDLGFSSDEVLEMLGPGASVDNGGSTWPIAVGLARELSSAPLLASQQQKLVAGILDTLDPATHDLVKVLGLVPGIDADTIRQVGPAAAATRLEVFAAKHPSLLRLEDRHWIASDLLTSYVRTVRVGDGLVKRVVAALQGDAMTQAYFLTTSGHPIRARQVLTEVAPDLIDSDRSHTAIRVLDLLGDTDDSAAVQLLRALARSTPTPDTITDLYAAWKRLGREDDPLALVAASLLAGALLMLGDTRAAAVAVEALCTATGASLEEAALRRALGAAGPAAGHLANLVSTLAILLFFTGRKADRVQARRLLELARGHMHALDAAFARGVEAAVELGTGGISPQMAVAHLERSVTQHRRAGTHAYGILLLELAGAHLEQGDVESAQRTGRELEDWIGEWGVTGLRPLSDAHLALCAIERGAAPPSAETAWSGIQEHAPERACGLATRVGNILLDRDDRDGAALWVARAEANVPHNTFADWECRVLRARFDTDTEALTQLGAIYRRAGAGHFATRVDRLVSGRTPPALRQHPRPPRVELLGPRIVVVHGEDRAYLRGFGAHLLALLVSRGGVVHSEVAIDTLWRDADPESARNRLYIVVHRLRRMLGVDDAVLHCADGLVNFAPRGTMDVDVYDFREALASGDPARAVFAYGSPFCSDQFLYDDMASSFRSELHAEFLRAARHAIEGALASGNTDLAVRLADHVVTLSGPGDEVVLLAARVFAADGQHGRSRRLLDREAHLAVTLGLDPEPAPGPHHEGTA